MARLPFLGALAGLGVLVVLLALPGASAHRDLALHDGIVELAPGASTALEAELHYHRIVGHVRALDAPHASLLLSIEGPDGERLAAQGDGTLAVNLLVGCCKGEFTTPHTIRVTNGADVPLRIDLRLVALHDGIAVAGDDAETGATASMVALFAIPAALLARRLTRTGAPSSRGSFRGWSAAAVALHVLMWAAALALALPAMARYGGDPAAATVAATADLPWTGHPILNTQSLVVLLLIALWTASSAAWTAAARRARSDVQARAVAALGGLFGAASIVACASWAIEYERLVAPLLVGLASAALPILGGIWLLVRRPPIRSTAWPSET